MNRFCRFQDETVFVFDKDFKVVEFNDLVLDLFLADSLEDCLIVDLFDRLFIHRSELEKFKSCLSDFSLKYVSFSASFKVLDENVEGRIRLYKTFDDQNDLYRGYIFVRLFLFHLPETIRTDKILYQNHILKMVLDLQRQFIDGADAELITEKFFEYLFYLTSAEIGFYKSSNERLDFDVAGKVRLYFNSLAGFTFREDDQLEERVDSEKLSNLFLSSKEAISLLKFDDPIDLFPDDNIKIEMILLLKAGDLENPLSTLALANISYELLTDQLLENLQIMLDGYSSILARFNLEGERYILEERLIEKIESFKKVDKVSNIGSWDFKIATDKLRWSSEIGNMLKLDAKKMKPSFKAFEAMIHPDDLTLVRKSIKAAIKQKSSYSIDHRLIRSDGNVIYIHHQGKVFLDRYSDPERIVGTMTDITDRKNLEIRLVEQTKRLIDNDEFRNKMISIMSHDIRSPLISSISLIELLLKREKDRLSEKGTEILNVLLRSFASQLDLVEKFLNLSAAKSKRIKIKIKETDLTLLIINLVDGLRQLADKKSVSVSMTKIEPANLMTDPDILSQILSNFLSNAIKFSNQGGLIEIGAEPVNEKVSIFVKDDGIGISESRLKSIKENFFLGSTLGTNDEKGTGLGLPICNELATLVGGSIDVKSEDKKGSTFKIILPKEHIDIDQDQLS